MDSIIALFLHKLPLFENVHQIKEAFDRVDCIIDCDADTDDISSNDDISCELQELRELYDIDAVVSMSYTIADIRDASKKSNFNKADSIRELEKIGSELTKSNFSMLTRAYTNLSNDLSDLILELSL